MANDHGLDIYTQFKKRSGSSNIAKPPAIDTILRICDRVHPTRVLELGGGIGTITYALLKYTNTHVDVYEQNNFCATELKKNLSGYEDRYTIIDSYLKLPPHRSYDLLIIDGGEAKDHAHGYSDTAWLFISYLDNVSTIYIEGNRHDQRTQARRALRQKGIFKLVRHKPVVYEGKWFLSGHEIRFRKSNIGVLRWLYYMWWELLLWTHSLLQRFLALIRHNK